MNFYEVLADGYHSPLTKTQITELFHAGRLRRDHRCKHVTHKEWQTVDELFPLLKYQSSGAALDYSPDPDAPLARTWILMFALLAPSVAAFALWYYFAHDGAAPAPRAYVTHSDSTRTISIPAPTAPKVFTQQPIDEEVVVSPPVTVEAFRPLVAPPQRQFAGQRRQTEQQATEQAQAQAERAAAERKAAGQDAIIPLDQQTPVNVGGYSVNVMIHDNDTTSFDVWINGLRRREVPKLKGITGSRTDETLIYISGGARLYYVWEISGQLNHCRLRVRED